MTSKTNTGGQRQAKKKLKLKKETIKDLEAKKKDVRGGIFINSLTGTCRTCTCTTCDCHF